MGKQNADSPRPKQRYRWDEAEEEKQLKCVHEACTVNGAGVQGVICRG